MSKYNKSIIEWEIMFTAIHEPRRPIAPYGLEKKLRLDTMDVIRATWSGVNMGDKIWVELKDGGRVRDGWREAGKKREEGRNAQMKRALPSGADSSSLSKLMSQCICLWFQCAAKQLRFEEEEIPKRNIQPCSLPTL